MAGIRMRDQTGVLRTITRIRVRDNTGALRVIQRIRMRDSGGTLRTVYQYLTATVTTDSIVGSGFGAASAGAVVSPSVTAVGAGGTTPYTHLWERVSGSGAITPTTGTAAATTFSANVNEASGGLFATYRCKITDALGAIVYSPEVNVEMYWTDTR